MIDGAQPCIRVGVEGCLRHADLLEAEDIAETVGEVLPDDRRRRKAGAVTAVRDVEADDPFDPIRVQERGAPDDDAAPVVPHERRSLDIEHVEQADGVGDQAAQTVRLHVVGLGGAAISALVIGNRPETRCGESRHLVAPRIGEFGKTVDEDDGLTGPLVDGREVHAIEGVHGLIHTPRLAQAINGLHDAANPGFSAFYLAPTAHRTIGATAALHSAGCRRHIRGGEPWVRR